MPHLRNPQNLLLALKSAARMLGWILRVSKVAKITSVQTGAALSCAEPEQLFQEGGSMARCASLSVLPVPLH